MQKADKKQAGGARHNTAEIAILEPYAAAALPPNSAFDRETGITGNEEKTLPCSLYRNKQSQAASHLYEDQENHKESSQHVGCKNEQDKDQENPYKMLPPLYSERLETENKAYRPTSPLREKQPADMSQSWYAVPKRAKDGGRAHGNDDPDNQLSNNDDPDNPLSNNYHPDKHVSNNDDPDNHVSNNDDLNNDEPENHVSNDDDLNNDESENYVSNDDDPNNDVSNTDDPDNHEYINDDLDNQVSDNDDSDDHDYDYEPSVRQPKVKDDSKVLNICCFVRGVAIALAVAALVGAGVSFVIFATLSLETDIITQATKYNNSCCTKVNIDKIKEGPVFSTTTFTWKITSCSDTSAHGTRLNTSVSPPSTGPEVTTVLSASCPGGYSSLRGTCYKAFAISKVFWAANDHCNLEGGNLAMPKDAATNNFLISLMKPFKYSFFWFGLHDLDKEGSFKWIDGTALGGFNWWNVGEPSNSNNIEDCAHYRCEGKWNDMRCSKELYFFCQVASASCPGDYRKWRGTCYKAYATRKAFWAANGHCKLNGGTLAMPKDTATNNFLISLTKHFDFRFFWFGLHDLDKEGSFQWIDGTALGGFNWWNVGEPNNCNIEDCAHYHWQGKWNDVDCSWKLYFFCQVAPGDTWGGKMQKLDKKQAGGARHNTAEIAILEPYAAAALPPNSAFDRETEITGNEEKTLPCSLYRNKQSQAASHLYEDKEDNKESSQHVGHGGRADDNDDPDNHVPNNDDPDNHVPNNDDSDNHVSNNDNPDNHVSNNDDSDNHVSNNDNPDNHVSNNDDPNDHVSNNDDPNDHMPNNDNPDNHVPNNDDSDNHVSNNDDPNDHVSNNDDPNDHMPNNDNPDNHVSNNDDPNDHVPNNDDPDNHEYNNDNPDNHVSNNDDPNDHVYNNDDPDNHEYNNDNPDNHVSNNDDPNDHVYNNDDPDNHEYDPSVRQPKVKDDWKEAKICWFVRGVAIALAVAALVGAGVSFVIFATLSLESDIVTQPTKYTNSCCTKVNIDKMNEGPVFLTTTFTWKITSCSGTSVHGTRLNTSVSPPSTGPEVTTVLSEVTTTPPNPLPRSTGGIILDKVPTTKRQTSSDTKKVVRKWRADWRCGDGYTTADGRTAECDPHSTGPCCSPGHWCGNTADHCDCAGCVDYRNTAASCPGGYRKFEGTCYRAFGDPKSFWAANERCRRDAGTLAMPKDAATHKFLISLMKRFGFKPFFFGLHDVFNEGRFEWIDGTKLGSFNSWNHGEPNNYRNREDCVAFVGLRWKWNDFDCSIGRYFLCQVAAGHT
ncbi:hypothetical protein Bbelb_303200 [Branchiostoma belcheri]|nr:hypothetical protein Bbelb_303200 [Branchiostoma belcheri]